MEGMHNFLGHHRLDAHRAVLEAQHVFTTQANGNSFPQWRRTLKGATTYIDGVLSPGKRKSMASIGERMDVPAHRVEQFITHSPWDHDPLQDHLIDTLPEPLQAADGALIIDEVGVPKQGTKSVGVARQWCGETGKIDTCQVFVNLVYTVPGAKLHKDHDTWPVGIELYLPKSWAENPARRERVGVPKEASFRTKPTIAGDRILDALDAGLDPRLVAGDAVYGDSTKLRARLRAAGQAYVLGINPSKHYVVQGHDHADGESVDSEHVTSVKDLIASLDGDAVDTVAWGKDPDGEDHTAQVFEQSVTVACKQDGAWVVTEERVRLLIEDRGNEVKAWLCWGLEDADREERVAWAHLRWAIEQQHRNTKQALGLGDFEGRSWQGLHHHLSMVLLAHAFVAQLRLDTGDEEGVGKAAFEAVVQAITLEVAIQELMDEHGLGHDEAEPLARTTLRRVLGWK